MAHRLVITDHAQDIIDGLKDDPKRVKKIVKVLALLEMDHRYPSLASHPYQQLDALYGERIWESYVEQGTPSAWRIWWFFGPEDGEITVVDLAKHP